VSTLAGRCLSLLLALLVRPLWAEEILLASPDYWCPFSCEAGSAREGFTVDIARHIFAEHGIGVRLVNLNYSRALRGVREGRYSATPSTLKDEAPDFIYPQLPISANRCCFFTRPDSTWDYRGVASLEGQRLAVVQDDAYGSELDQFIQHQGRQVRVLKGDRVTPRQLQLLERGLIDTFVEEEKILLFTLASQARKGMPLRTAGCEAPRYADLALSPANPRAAQYARWFDEGMRRLRGSGELAKILAAYGLRDWQR
jgi:polar amino acid transport system substrate-binding protein